MPTFDRFSRRALVALVTFLCGLLWVGLSARAQVALEKEDFDYAYRLYNDSLYDLAATQFLRFTAAHPESPHAAECVFMAGQSFLKAGHLRKAKNAFSRVAVEFPESDYVDRALWGMASVYAREGKPCAAASSLERIAILTPGSRRLPRALLRAARLYQACARNGRAAELLERVLHDYRGTGVADIAKLELARLRVRTGRPDLAEKLLDQLKVGQTTDSLAAEASLVAARLYSSVLRFDRAEARYRQVAEAAPTPALKARGVLGLAQLELARGNPSGATQILSRLPASGLPDSLVWRSRILRAAAAVCAGKRPAKLSLFNGQTQTLPRKMRREILLARALVASRMADETLLAQSARALWLEVRADSVAAWPVLALQLWLRSGKQEAVRSALSYVQNHSTSDSLYGLTVSAARVLLSQPAQRKRAEALLSQFLLRYPGSPSADLAAFLLLRSQLNAGTTISTQDFEQWLQQFPESELETQVRVLADSVTLYAPVLGTDGARVVLALAAKSSAAQLGAKEYLRGAQVALGSLKDYRLASVLARQAVAAGLRGTQLRAALQVIGESFLRRSQLAERAGQVELARQLADSASMVFDLALKRTASSGDCELKKVYARAVLASSADVTSKLATLKSLAGDSAEVCPPVVLALSKALWELSGHGEHDSTALEAFRTAGLLREQQGEAAEEAAFLRMQIALSRKDSAAAEQEASSYLDRFGPDSRHWGKVACTRAALSLAGRQPEQAADLLQRVVQARSYADLADSARVLWARAERERGKLAKALSILRQISGVGFVPGAGRLPTWTVCFERQRLIRASEAKIEAARVALAAGKSFRALALVGQLRRVLASLPPNTQASALLLQAEAAKKLGRTNEWLYALRTLWENPSLPLGIRKRAVFDLLDGWLENRAYRQALELSKAVQKEMGEPSDLARAAEIEVVCTYRLDRLKEARSLARQFGKKFKGAVDLSGPEARFAYEEGEYYFRQKLFDRAEKAYRKAARYQGTEWARRAEFAIAKTYLTLNKTDKALSQLTDLPQKYPDTEVADLALLNLGVFYHQNKQLANAIFTLSKVVADSQRLDPGTLRSAERELIRCYDEAGMWDRAIALSRDYLRRFPGAEDAFSRKVQIGVLLIRLNEYDRAIDYLRQLKLEADPESEAEVQYWIGKAFLSKGDLETAIAELLRVRYACPPTKLPWDVTAMFEAASAYMRLQKYDRAQKLFEQIVRLRGSTSNFGRSALQKIKEIQELRGT